MTKTEILGSREILTPSVLTARLVILVPGTTKSDTKLLLLEKSLASHAKGGFEFPGGNIKKISSEELEKSLCPTIDESDQEDAVERFDPHDARRCLKIIQKELAREVGEETGLEIDPRSGEMNFFGLYKYYIPQKDTDGTSEPYDPRLVCQFGYWLADPTLTNQIEVGKHPEDKHVAAHWVSRKEYEALLASNRILGNSMLSAEHLDWIVQTNCHTR